MWDKDYKCHMNGLPEPDISIYSRRYSVPAPKKGTASQASSFNHRAALGAAAASSGQYQGKR
jgi:hypothetical protein